MSDAVSELARALRAEPSPEIAALSPDVLRRLIEQIEIGRCHHRDVAEQAIDKAIRTVPLPVRRIVRKALA